MPRHSELEPDAVPVRAKGSATMEPPAPSEPAKLTMDTDEVLVLELKQCGKELDPKLFSEAEWELFKASDVDQLNAHLKTCAFEVLDRTGITYYLC
eukprot:1643585-Amphidinium_carterae.2